MPKGFSIKKMKEIQKQIHELPEDCQETIFHIIKEGNEIFTENTNGVFFDIMTLTKETLERILKFLKFCENCTEYLDEREREQTTIKKDMGITS